MLAGSFWVTAVVPLVLSQIHIKLQSNVQCDWHSVKREFPEQCFRVMQRKITEGSSCSRKAVTILWPRRCPRKAPLQELQEARLRGGRACSAGLPLLIQNIALGLPGPWAPCLSLRGINDTSNKWVLEQNAPKKGTAVWLSQENPCWVQ